MVLGFRLLPIRRPALFIVRSISGATIDRTIDRLWLPLVVRSSSIVVDRATTRTTNRTMTYHQQERPIAVNVQRICPITENPVSSDCAPVSISHNNNGSHIGNDIKSETSALYAWEIAGVNLSRLVTRIVSDFQLSAYMHSFIDQ